MPNSGKKTTLQKSVSVDETTSKANLKNKNNFQSFSSLVSVTTTVGSSSLSRLSLNKTSRETLSSAIKLIRSKTSKKFKSENILTPKTMDKSQPTENVKNSSGKKNKTSGLIRKFTSLKKSKSIPNKKDNKKSDIKTDSSYVSRNEELSNSSSSLKRHTPEGGLVLNSSQTSLLIIDDEETLLKENSNEYSQNTLNILPVNIQLPTETINVDVVPNSPSTSKGLVASKNTIASNKCLLDSPGLHVKLSAENQLKIDETTIIKTTPGGSIIELVKSPDNIIPSDGDSNSNTKGATRKSLKKSRDEFFEAFSQINPIRRRSKDVLLVVEKSNQNSLTSDEEPLLIPSSPSKRFTTPGNNLKNPNLSNFKSIEDLENECDVNEKSINIKFNIGKSVRPQIPKTIIDSSELVNELVSLDLGLENSLDSSNYNESGSLRRRISFVSRPQIFSEEYVEGHDSVKIDSPSYLSGLSVYSDQVSDSLSSENSMPPHGDLIVEQTNMSTQNQQIATSSTAPEKREYLYKILVIGELGTGKTSFIRRYVHNFFSQNYRATIGVDFALKVLNWDQKSIIRLQLWDIAGQERFGNMTRVYYKEAAGAFIVFDVTRSATFDAVIKWKQDLDSKVQLPDGSPIPCILLANKCDQPKQGTANNSSKLDEYVKENGFAGWYETSAKDNINIEEASKALVNKVLQNDKMINAGVVIDNDKIALDGHQSDIKQKKNCISC